MNVLVVSAEPRLVNAIRSNLPDAEICSVGDAASAQNELFQNSYPLALIDFESVKGADLQTFITIDNVLVKERTLGAFMVRAPTAYATELEDRLSSIEEVIDMSQGRPQFVAKIQDIYKSAELRVEGPASTIGGGGLRHQVDLPALEEGSLVEFPLARVLYTIRQRKESGVLKLKYAGHELEFGFIEGKICEGGSFEPSSELLGAFSWSHGTYNFTPDDVSGETTSVIALIAEGCREHIRQRGITELMTPVMRRYPVPTNLWEERRQQLEDYATLQEVMMSIDGSTNWEKALSSLGQRVTEGFRAAYFAIQLDLVHTTDQAGFEHATVEYSREVRKARAKVDQAKVEETKAFQASTNPGRSKLELELGARLSMLRDQTAHEVFEVWEGCGRKVVQERFYVLVKENHPDVYGGNTDGKVLSLAQDIFILIKDSYQELLAEEGEQTVPPPEAASRKQTPGRAPQKTAHMNASPAKVQAQEEARQDSSVDVKKKLAMMSGYRKREKHRQRLRSRQGHSEASDASEVSDEQPREEEAVEAPPPEPELDPEEQKEKERQAKLNHLLKRAQSAPGGPKPAQEYWSKGFNAYKESRNEEAFENFKRAYEFDPKDGPILTFYAYTRFLTHPNVAEETEQMLRDALQTGDRQSAPDACLFLGHVLKSQGKVDEALSYYKRALKLNPASREAEREVRLAEKRGQSGGRKESDPGNFLKSLFKK